MHDRYVTSNLRESSVSISYAKNYIVLLDTFSFLMLAAGKSKSSLKEDDSLITQNI